MDFRIDVEILEIAGYPSIVYIESNSDRSRKNQLATLAKYFKREMRIDNLQYDQSMYRNDDLVGFLFLHRAMDLVKSEDHFPSRVIGGGVFVHRHNSFELDWVWLHPFSRNRRILRENWKAFQTRFGQFSVASPLSAHMSDFIKKHHTPPRDQGATGGPCGDA